MKHATRSDDGFTLLEVLVTTVMIAVLTIIGIVSYSAVNKRSRDTKRKSDLEQIRSALEMYRSDSATGEYPSLGDGSVANASGLSGSLVPTYIPVIPDDSDTTHPYIYESFPAGGPYTSYCVFAYLETLTSIQSTCTASSPPSDYNYGLKSP